jgi:hypothetical protein
MANNLKNTEKTRFKSGSKAVEAGKKGGVASGVAKREKKAMKDTLKALLTLPLDESQVADIETIKSLAALEGKNITVQEAILLQQVKKAMDGDTKAAEYVRDTAGDKPTDKVELNSKIDLDEKINEIEEYMKKMDG